MKKPKHLKCGKCSHQFSLYGGSKAMVSCPGCGAMMDVAASQIRSQNPDFKVTRPSRRVIILEPRKHTGLFKCLECAKSFTFTKDLRDVQERYTEPHCSHCGSPKVKALTPVASAETKELPEGRGKRARLARFVKRNFKAYCELKSHFGETEGLVKRAALPPRKEVALLQRLQKLQEEVLASVQGCADQRLQERMRSLGIADGEDLF